MKTQEANNIQCNPTLHPKQFWKVTVGEEPLPLPPERTEAAPGAPGDAEVDSAGRGGAWGAPPLAGAVLQSVRLHSS